MRLLILVLVITPKVEVPNEAPGLENSGVFMELKTSIRNCSECCSLKGILNVLNKDRSAVCVPGPTTGSRGAVPYWSTLGEKAAVLNHRDGPGLAIATDWLEFRFGYSQVPASFCVSAASPTWNGLPDAKVMIPFRAHPSATTPARPCRFLANGSSQTYPATNRCR